MKITRWENDTVGSCLQTLPRKIRIWGQPIQHNRMQLSPRNQLSPIRLWYPNCRFLHLKTLIWEQLKESQPPLVGSIFPQEPQPPLVGPTFLLTSLGWLHFPSYSPLINPALLSSLHPSGFLSNSNLTKAVGGDNSFRKFSKGEGMSDGIGI